MDQTTPEIASDEFSYERYVEERRERVAAEEVTIPETVTCHIDMDADVADALLDLIAQNAPRYGVKSQAYLHRASRSLEAGLRSAAEAYAKTQSR